VTDADVVLEGFPHLTREAFIALLLRINRPLRRSDKMTRIEFKYVKDEP
jgi:hypothetical protein